MRWRKSPPELIERFLEALPPNPRIERRQMFGYPAAFIAGRLFAGLHQEDVVVRLPDDTCAALIAAKTARRWEPMPGRRMRSYVAIGAEAVADMRVLRQWLTRAARHVATLPAKPAARRRLKSRS